MLPNFLYFFALAVVKLQSLFRGHSSRKKSKLMKDKGSTSSNNTSTTTSTTTTNPINNNRIKVRRPSSAGAGKIKMIDFDVPVNLDVFLLRNDSFKKN